MFTITKEVHFCYGHRLLRHPGKCRNLHGHSVKAAITLSSPVLNEQAMVCDFFDLKRSAESYIDEQLDHNLLLHKDDPLVALLVQSGERVLALDEHPTAEYLAQLIYRHFKNLGHPVSHVTLWETESACATYSET